DMEPLHGVSGDHRVGLRPGAGFAASVERHHHKGARRAAFSAGSQVGLVRGTPGDMRHDPVPLHPLHCVHSPSLAATTQLAAYTYTYMVTDYREITEEPPVLASVRVLIGHYMPHLLIAMLSLASLSSVMRMVASSNGVPSLGAPSLGGLLAVTPWWAYVAFVVILAAFVYTWIGHAKGMCPRCAKLPRNGPRSAARAANTLWLYHQTHAHPPTGFPVKIVAFQLLIIALLVSQFIWGEPAVLAFNVVLSAHWWAFIQHQRLAMWCPCAAASRSRTRERADMVRPSGTGQFLLTARVLQARFDDGPFSLTCNTGSCEDFTEEFDTAEQAVEWLADHLDLHHE